MYAQYNVAVVVYQFCCGFVAYLWSKCTTNYLVLSVTFDCPVANVTISTSIVGLTVLCIIDKRFYYPLYIFYLFRWDYMFVTLVVFPLSFVPIIWYLPFVWCMLGGVLEFCVDINACLPPDILAYIGWHVCVYISNIKKLNNIITQSSLLIQDNGFGLI